MNIRSLALAGAFMFSATALAACGDDSSSSSSTTSDGAGEKTTAAAPAKTASLDTVLACLKKAGLDAKDQSSSFGSTIGIDYSGGRTVISFQESADEAGSYESAAAGSGSQPPLRVGNVVVSFADDPAVLEDRPAIETCLA